MPSNLFAFSCDTPYAKLDLKKENPDNAWLGAACVQIEDVCRNAAFNHLPFDTNAIRALANKVQAKNAAELATFFETLKPSQLEEQLKPLITFYPKPEDDSELKKWESKNAGLLELAVASYVNAVFAKTFPAREKSNSTNQANKVASPYLRLVVNVPGWMLVKKSPSNATPQEIAAACAGIYATASRKVFEYGCANPAAFETLWASVEAKVPERKSVQRAAQVLKEFAGTPAIADCKPADEKAFRAAFVARLLARAGFAPYITTEAISAAFPELKIPKPRGNYGGGKKKKKQVA